VVIDCLLVARVRAGLFGVDARACGSRVPCWRYLSVGPCLFSAGLTDLSSCHLGYVHVIRYRPRRVKLSTELNLWTVQVVLSCKLSRIVVGVVYLLCASYGKQKA